MASGKADHLLMGMTLSDRKITLKKRFWILLGIGALVVAGGGFWWKVHAVPQSVEVELDRGKQRYIWDTEHLTFEIETHVCKPFARALRKRNAERLAGFFQDGFAGFVLDPAEGQTLRAGAVAEHRRDGAGTVQGPLDAATFVGSLISSVAVVKQIEKSGLRVLQIDRVDQDSGRWALKLLLTVQGTYGTEGLAEVESEHQVEVRFLDEDEIAGGRLFTHWQVGKERVRTSPRVLMKEVTEKVGFSRLPLIDNWTLPWKKCLQYRFQMAVEDFDRDGFPDIAIATAEGVPMLLHSVGGGRFENVAEKMGIQPCAPSNSLAAWIDYDNDGYPDLLLGGHLYHNVGGQRFVDVTAESGLQFPGEPMGCAVADYNCDGRLDLYVLYQDPVGPAEKKRPWVGDADSGSESQLWRNEGNGRFRNVTAEAGLGRKKRNSFAAAWFFYEPNDRFPSLYVANDFGHNLLFRNRGDGTFEDITEATGTGDYSTSMGVAIGDLDNDGVPEIYVANMYSKMGRRIIAHVEDKDYPPGIFDHIKGACAGNRLLKRKPGETSYQDQSGTLGVNAVGWAYAPLMADLDGDGYLDLYATDGFLSFRRDKPDG